MSKRNRNGLNSYVKFGIFFISALTAIFVLLAGIVPLLMDLGDWRKVQNADFAIEFLESQFGYRVLGADVAFDGSFWPTTNSTYDLGKTDYQWRDLYISGDIHGSTGRGSTVVVAASDASALSKAQADYVVTGTADDEIQAAIATGARHVLLTEGNFEGGKINVGFSDLTVSGQGSSTTYKLADGTNDNVFEAKAAAQGDITNVIIANLLIDANASGQTSAPADGANGIYFSNIDNFYIGGLHIQDTYSHVVALRGSRYGVIENLIYSGQSSSNNHGIDLDISDSSGVNSHIAIANNQFNITGGSYGDLCKFESAHFITITNNSINCNGIGNGIGAEGIGSPNGSAGGVSHIVIANNTIKDPTGYGVSIYGVQTGPVLITGNSVYNSGDMGMYVYGTSMNVTIEGNVIEGSANEGIDVPTGRYIRVLNNTILSSGTYGVSLNSALYWEVKGNLIQKGATSVAILSTVNACWGEISGNTLQFNNIGIDMYGDYISVVGNTIFANANTGFFMKGSSHCIVNDNVIVSNGWTTAAQNKDGLRMIDSGARYCLYNLIANNRCYDDQDQITSLLTGNAAAAQKVVVVADVSRFWEGQRVTISDDTPDTETNQVDTIDLSTNTITMTTNLANDYTVAQNAKVTGYLTQRRGISEEGNSDYNEFKDNHCLGNIENGVILQAVDTQVNVDKTPMSIALDLTGGATDIEVFYAMVPCKLVGYTILYSEATGEGAGVNIRIGRYQDGVALDDDYFDVSVSEVNKNKGYSKHFAWGDLTKRTIAKGDTVTVGTAGAKADTGAVIIILQIVEMTS